MQKRLLSTALGMLLSSGCAQDVANYQRERATMIQQSRHDNSSKIYKTRYGLTEQQAHGTRYEIKNFNGKKLRLEFHVDLNTLRPCLDHSYLEGQEEKTQTGRQEILENVLIDIGRQSGCIRDR